MPEIFSGGILKPIGAYTGSHASDFSKQVRVANSMTNLMISASFP
jgi:hypothetical protein